jgi:hypothetical protein
MADQLRQAAAVPMLVLVTVPEGKRERPGGRRRADEAHEISMLKHRAR